MESLENVNYWIQNFSLEFYQNRRFPYVNWSIIKETEIPVAILFLSLIFLPHMVGEGISGCLKKKKDRARASKWVNTSLLIYSILFALSCYKIVNTKSRNWKHVKNENKVHREYPVRLYGIKHRCYSFRDTPIYNTNILNLQVNLTHLLS